ncbi:MAG: NAD+ synthase [Planctomycetota bacterium]|nr:MAG: NAD+ synthase [Planctomycetota bacterium]REK33043.1 MAG: NAD+ synthase [Planctomycetota bacterium]
MKIALAQLNPTVGDVSGNAALLRKAVEDAGSQGAVLVVASELVVSGYPPKDLLLRDGFVEKCEAAVADLATEIDPRIGLVLGHPAIVSRESRGVCNAASLIYQGRVAATVHKRLLPNYDVFDEQRYFRPAESVTPVEFDGRTLGIHICEDAWWGEPRTFYHHDPCRLPDPVAELAAAGADCFINLSASPFEVSKPVRRDEIMVRHARRHQRPVLFCNQVGGNDDLVFDGHSFVADSQGAVVRRLHGFRPDLQVVDLDDLGTPCEPFAAERRELILNAVVLGLRDYMHKCGFTDAVLGLSGGIDSALACYLAARAISPEHVHGLLMPSRYSSQHSIEDAQRLAENLGIDWEVIPIDEVHRGYESLPVIGDDLRSQPAGLADQNLQARIRGAIVMTRSNRHGWMALATGNKSELAVGYCTLYGDMCGGFAVLSDLLKRDVYAVARYVNDQVEGREVIPESTLSKSPSAELAPDQRDEDSLPPYPVLDSILECLIEREESPRELCREFPPETVRWVVRALDRNEFKRRQMPPGIKLSQRAFGSGRRMPMAARVEVEP